MSLRYVTVKGFWEFLGLNESVLDFRPGQKPIKETVANNPVDEGDFYLNQMGVNEDTLILYADDDVLDIGDDYTFDSNTSKIHITAAGEAKLIGKNLLAEYEFNNLGKHLNFKESVALLEYAERKIHDKTNTVFTTLEDADYTQIKDEYHTGKGVNYVNYQLLRSPLIRLRTTVAVNYTTGGTELELEDATGFPESGTIFVGGFKVTYTAKTGNVLTVPATTPDVLSTTLVVGEVIEINTSGPNVGPSWQILTPDRQYVIDYMTGEVQLLSSYYFSDANMTTTQNWAGMPPPGIKDRFRATYLTAWTENETPVIPSEIIEAVYMIAGRQLVQRTIIKSLAGQRDNFNPQSFGFSKEDIDEIIRRYKTLPSGRA